MDSREPREVIEELFRRRLAGDDGAIDELVAEGFEVGVADCLALPDAVFDAAISECVFCTFPDKPTAAAEMARVLRPGGRRSTTPARCSKPPASASTTSNVTTTRSAPVELVSNRLRALRLLDLPLLRSFDLRRAIDITRRVHDVIERGDAGYFLLTATKGDA